jgi:hypothetical protein
MPAAATQPTGKRSRRGRLSEGAPTKKTPQVVAKIAYAIGLGLNDTEAADYAGVSDLTLTTWRKDPEFLRKIKVAVSTRLAKRLAKIEAGAEGWQGCGWLLERLYPTRFSKPEVQISLSNSYQTVNALTITIAPEEAARIEEVAKGTRERVRQLYAQYRPLEAGNGNGKEVGQPIAEVETKPVVDVEAKPVGVVALEPIRRNPGDEGDPRWWKQFCLGTNSERPVDRETAAFVAVTILTSVIGPRGHQALRAFPSDDVTVGTVLEVIEKHAPGAGWQRLQKMAGY